MRVRLAASAAAILLFSSCGAGASFPVFPTSTQVSAPHDVPFAPPASPETALEAPVWTIPASPPPTPWTMPDPQPRPPRRPTFEAAALPPHRVSAPEWRCDEWMPLAVEVGWPEEELSQLSYVIYRESRCDPAAFNPDDPMGGSAGLSQLNFYFCKRTRYHDEGYFIHYEIIESCDDLFDPRLNLEAALFLWENSGWGPWGM